MVLSRTEDERVNIDKAIAFSRKVVASSAAKKKPSSQEFLDVELHVMPWPDQGGTLRWLGEDANLNAHDAAAAWLLARME